MKETSFFKWLIDKGQRTNSAQSIISRVKRIETVYPDLCSRIEDESIVNLLNVFTYTKADEAKGRNPLHKIEIEGNLYTGTQSLRTALIQYIEFMQSETKAEEMSNNSNNADSYINPMISEEEKLYKIDEFREWMHWRDEMTKESANSYVSYLNNLRLQITRKSDGILILDYISGCLKDGNVAIAFELLEKVDEFVSKHMLSCKRDKYEKTRLNNGRSALRKYILFLEDDIEELPDEEELDTAGGSGVDLATQFESVSDDNVTENITYSLTDLKQNFIFRLKTQNRMSNHKDVFYPIGMICKLFNYSQRNAKREGVYNKDAEWLNDWFNDYADTIVVVTANGEYPLSRIKEIAINIYSGTVSLLLPECCERHIVYTEAIHDEKFPMFAKRLRDIHIDHTPLMSNVLSMSLNNLHAFTAFSEVIRKVAKQKRLDIKPSNFGKISKNLFENTDIVDKQLLPLIPELKNELDLLRGRCVLKLMQGSLNLQKK